MADEPDTVQVPADRLIFMEDYSDPAEFGRAVALQTALFGSVHIVTQRGKEAVTESVLRAYSVTEQEVIELDRGYAFARREHSAEVERIIRSLDEG